jgi:Flp pilus assembly protein TadG
MSFARTRKMKDLNRFSREQAGGGTIFSLFVFLALLLIGSLAVDSSNAWRSFQQMKQTADIASHAGAVALANGDTDTIAKTDAIDAVQWNMPSSVYGTLFEDETTDVYMLNYDPENNAVSSTGKMNAVGVIVHRNDTTGNSVNTLFMNFVSFVSGNNERQDFEINVRSISALSATRACSSSNGIYAKDKITLTSSNAIGGRYCLHSQSDVWLPQQNTFEPTAGLSMPDLEDCGGKCTDSANPGSEAAAFESNYIMPDLNAWITDTALAFTDTFGSFPEKDKFFASKSLETSALPALEAVGINTSGLIKGDVVDIDQSDFEILTEIPAGLVYNVSCLANGNGPNTRLSIDASNGGNDLTDVAVITNCSLDFGATANISGSLLVTTRVSSNSTVNADSGAFIGSSSYSCNADEKSIVMALSDMNVPADFAGSNVAFIVDGDIHLSASSSSSVLEHSGVSFHASGQIHVSSNHTFNSCATAPSGLMPELLVIRHVEPTVWN